MTKPKEHRAPEKVIRFYGNVDYALESVALKQITFVHLEKLNDPFDFLLDQTTDFNNNYESLLAYIQKHTPSNLNLFKARLPKQNWLSCINDWSIRAKKLKNTTFVFSTCEVIEDNHPCDNLYMWGHYGNGHRGVAIEFDTTTLSKSLLKDTSSDIETVWWKMEYTKKIPKIKCEDIVEFVLNTTANSNKLEADGQKLSKVIRQRHHSKSEVWMKENEWRLVWNNDETKLKIHRHNLPSNAIKAVYLGCRLPKQQAEYFIYETQRNFPNASVFQAKMKKGEYALDFEKAV